MGAQVVVTQTDTGWDVHSTGGDDVVVRTEGARIVVAVTPDADDQPPLAVSLAPTPDPHLASSELF